MEIRIAQLLKVGVWVVHDVLEQNKNLSTTFAMSVELHIPFGNYFE